MTRLRYISYLFPLLRMGLVGCLLFLVSCGTTTYLPTTTDKDSVRVVHSHDTLRIYERDSVFIDRYHKGDTVFIERDRWRTKTEYKTIERIDTVYQNRNVVETQVQEVVPKYYRDTSIGFWILFAAWVVVIAAKILKKIYLRR